MTPLPVVLMVCDAGPTVGIGHVMRCLALGEEFVARGFDVVVAAELTEVPWVAARLESRGIRVLDGARATEDAASLLDVIGRVRPLVTVVDSYVLPAPAYAQARAALGPDRPLVALVDGDPGGRAADVYLDQNIGAEDDEWPLAEGSQRLAGLGFCLMRDEILAFRPAGPSAHRDHDPPHVLAFFGGTDAYGAAPVLLPALAATGAPFCATVVASGPRVRADLESVRLAAGQSLEVIGPSDRLAALVANADVVVSAAGTSTWELCCLGAATALVCVADNQRESYGRAVALGLAVGLGELSAIPDPESEATRLLAGLLADPVQREQLRETGSRLVDGAGRVRVVDAVLSRIPGAR